MLGPEIVMRPAMRLYRGNNVPVLFPIRVRHAAVWHADIGDVDSSSQVLHG